MWRYRGHKEQRDTGACDVVATHVVSSARAAAAALRDPDGGAAAINTLLDTINGVGGVTLPPAECARLLGDVAEMINNHYPTGNAAHAARAMDALSRQLGEIQMPRETLAVIMDALSSLLGPLRDDNTRLHAARCAGSIVFVGAERCTPWSKRLLDDLPIAPPASMATRHAALVCCGNILRGSRARDLHAGAVPAVVAVITATCCDTSTHADIDDVSRLLSSALRALHCVLTAADTVAMEVVASRGEELVRALHTCTTFGLTAPRTAPASTLSVLSLQPHINALALRGAQQRQQQYTRHSRAVPTISAENDVAARSGATSANGAITELPAAASHRHHPGGPGSWYTDSDDGGGDDDDEASDDSSAELRRHIWGGGSERGTSRGSGRPRRIPIRVRVTALHCIALLARELPRLLQPRWAALVPEVQGLHPKPFAPSLLTVLLFDASSRVREAAACALGAVVAAVPLDKWVSGGSMGPRVASQRTAPRTAFAGLSDKTAASLGQLHAALEHALHREMMRPTVLMPEARTTVVVPTGQSPRPPAAHGHVSEDYTGSLRHPLLVASILRTAAITLSSSPYQHLTARLACPLVSRIVELLAMPSVRQHGHVIVSALHAVGALLSSPSSNLAVLLCGVPALVSPSSSSDGSDAHAAMTCLVRLLAALDVTTTSRRNAEQLDWSKVRDGGTRRAPPVHTAQSRVAAALRPELLAVISKAVRVAPDAVTSAWSVVGPLVLGAFGDAVAAVRVTALKLMEELLSARSAALRQINVSDDPDGDFSIGGSVGLMVPAHHEHGGSFSGSSNQCPSRWTRIFSDSAVTIPMLLHLHILRAMRDPTASVRAAAAAVVSYLLPEDWRNLVQCAPTVMRSEASSNSPADPGTRFRNELLASVVDACCDGAASVRAASARVLGAYASSDEWRTPAFLRLSANLLIGMLVDDSVSVRVKASWALGHVCARPALSSAETAAAVYTPSVAARDAEGYTSAVFPAPGEVDADALSSLLRYVHEAAALSVIQRSISAPIDAAPGFAPTAPAALIDGASQSHLAALLTVPLLRNVATSVLAVAGSDQDRVVCTAVRTLGLCAQALILHWLSLPAEHKYTVDPVVIVSRGPAMSACTHERCSHEDTVSTGTRTVHRPPVRRRIVACPDNALIKSIMLQLADIVAIDHVAGPLNMSNDTQTMSMIQAPRHPSHGRADDVFSAVPAASPAQQRGPAMRNPIAFARHKPTVPVGRPLAVVNNTITAASNGVKITGPATDTPLCTDGESSVMNGVAELPAKEGGVIRSQQLAACSAGAAKVRWNACHAVALILPLLHRLSAYHNEDWAPPVAERGYCNGLGGTALTLPQNVRRPPSAGAIATDVTEVGVTNSSVGITSSVVEAAELYAPIRPRARRNSASGSTTSFAGVDHVSTDNTPFAGRSGESIVDRQWQCRWEDIEEAAAGSIPARDDTNSVRGTPTQQVIVMAGEGPMTVTDPTIPSVTLDATWIPPVLAALQAALMTCANYKVRIAAAQALSLMPSRNAFRIPSAAIEEGDCAASTSHVRMEALTGPLPSYRMPLLQVPGYDAFPGTFATLMSALERAVADDDAAERRYRAALLVALRVALLRVSSLAQRVDYRHAQHFFESNAATLVDWLEAESVASASVTHSTARGHGEISRLSKAVVPSTLVSPADVARSFAALHAVYSCVTVDALLLARLRAGSGGCELCAIASTNECLAALIKPSSDITCNNCSNRSSTVVTV